MAETKWTPGPWAVDTLGVGTPWTIDTLDDNVALANQLIGDDLKQSRRTANARLIASAPDLLEALEGAMRRHDCMCPAGAHIEGCWYPKASAAVAKARGK